MFAGRFNLGDGRARAGDERLSALLREWKGWEPSSGFEVAVWRRIRSASVPEQRRLPVIELLREWFVPRPVWANALAAAAGIAIGIGLAFSIPGARDRRQNDLPLLSSQTLSGSYLAMVTGGTR